MVRKSIDQALDRNDRHALVAWLSLSGVRILVPWKRSRSEESGRFTGLYTRATGAGTYAALFLPLALFHARYRFSGFGKVFAWMVVALFLIQPVLASARAALVVSLGVAVVLGFFYYGSRALIGLIAAALFLPVPFLLDSKLIDKVQARAEKVVSCRVADHADWSP